MSSYEWIDEVSVMLHVEVYKSVVVEIPVAPPAVSEDSGSRKHLLRVDGGKCRFISDVFRIYRQEENSFATDVTQL